MNGTKFLEANIFTALFSKNCHKILSRQFPNKWYIGSLSCSLIWWCLFVILAFIRLKLDECHEFKTRHSNIMSVCDLLAKNTLKKCAFSLDSIQIFCFQPHIGLLLFPLKGFYLELSMPY